MIEKLPLEDEVLHGLSENLKQLPLRLRIQYNLQLSIYTQCISHTTRTAYKIIIAFECISPSIWEQNQITPVWKIIEINPIEKPIFEKQKSRFNFNFFLQVRKRHNHS